MEVGFDPDLGWQIFLKFHGQPKEPVQLSDTADLQRPGIEKLRLTPKEVGNGEAPAAARAFALLKLGPRWETIIEGDGR